MFHNIPELPTHHLPRDEDLNHVKTLLLAGSVAISAPSIRVGVQGMGGIGKSVLAAAVAHDSEVQKAFPDGIVWVPIGQTPALVSLQFDVMTALGVNPQPFDNSSQGTTRLREALRDKRCLLILDDVWKSPDAFAFNALGSQGRMLVTTRKLSTISTLTHHQHEVKVLSEAQALQLLGRWFNQTDFERIPVDTRKALVHECGCLPLAVASVGALLKRRPGRENNILKKLREADLAAIKEQFPDYPYPDLLKALQVSVDDLSEDLRERYLDFAVFPEEVQIPEQVLCTFWQSLGLDEDDCQDVIDELVDRSLLTRNQEGKLSLHDLQRDYTRSTCGNLVERHQALLDAYGAKCPQGWASGPNDGYFFEHLAGHLIQAGKPDEARALLFDFEWLRLKLEYCNTVAVINDFDTYLKATQPPVSTRKQTLSAEKLVRDALQLSSHILNKDTTQLRSQLWGRLAGFEHPEIKALLEQAREFHSGLWLRPICPSMAKPGGPLLFTLEGHDDAVTAIDIFPDEKWIVSGTRDGTLKVWNLETREELATLKGHRSYISAVSVLRDGRRIISASTDMTLKVWDIEHKVVLTTLTGHTSWVLAMAVLVDEKQVVSASADTTLKIWDIESGSELATLTGHNSYVTAISVVREGRQIISASNDQTFKVWDIEQKKVLATFDAEHKSEITTILLSNNDRRMLTASLDQTIKVWDFEQKEVLFTLVGHTERVTSLASLGDDRRIISASWDETIRVWDLEHRAELSIINGHTSMVTTVMKIGNEGKIISGAFDTTLKIWDINQRFNQLNGHSDEVTTLAMLSEGKNIISASKDLQIIIWDVDRGEELSVLTGHTSNVLGMAVLDEKHQVIFASEDDSLWLLELEGPSVLKTFYGHNNFVTDVRVLPGESRIVSASWDETLKIWEINSGKELATLVGHNHWVTALAVLPDGLRIISASNDQTLKVWDLNLLKEIFTLIGHTLGVNTVAVLGDGRWVASGSDDQTLKVWDVETKEVLATFTGHTAGVTVVTEIPDRSRLVSASMDKTLKVWDLETQRVLLTYVGDAPFTACAVSPDGTMIFAGDSLGRIHFLKLESDKVTE